MGPSRWGSYTPKPRPGSTAAPQPVTARATPCSASLTTPSCLFGPYEPPALRQGDRAHCLYRDADVVVTGWSDGRISWPRCRALGHRGGSGLLVEEELARAIMHESGALLYWWGTC
jgi:hypothetical protein